MVFISTERTLRVDRFRWYFHIYLERQKQTLDALDQTNIGMKLHLVAFMSYLVELLVLKLL